MSVKSLFSPLDAIKFLFKKPHTVRVPYEKKEPATRYRGVHVNDWEKCIGCGNCARICTCQAITMVPIDTIEPKPGTTNLRPKVDYGRCSFCGQCVDICPTGSLKLSTEYLIVSPNKEDYVFIPNLNRDSGPGTGWESDVKTHLLRFEREDMPERSPEERRKDFDPVILGFRDEQAVVEGYRCLGCALCVDGCPTHMFIPEYIEKIREAKYKDALDIFFKNNPLPEICGIVCTHNCEDACIYSWRGQPVQIRYLKGFGASKVDNYGEVIKVDKEKKIGKRVAVIGAGPAGLTLAFYLRKYGIEVTIYEAYPEPGGMMRYGIPRYRLPEKVLRKEIEFIKSTGVEIKFNTKVGREIKLKELLQEYDAVFIGVGFHRGLTMRIPGEDAVGVIQAADFLRDVSMGKEVKIGKRVIVVGGGDVAMDASRTALRLGAEEVIIMYRRRWVDMPAHEEEKREAKDEGVIFMTQTLPVEIVKNEDGSIKVVKYVKTRMVDRGGRRPEPVPIEDEVYEMEADTVIQAIGQRADYSLLNEEFKGKIQLDERGTRIIVDENGMTSVEGLFAGGDVVNRRGDIVSAIADARKAARGILKYLGVR